MSKELIVANSDLAKLRDEGYELEIRSDHLLIHNIPYLMQDGTLGRGIMVSTLHLETPIKLGRPETHKVMFNGEFPCDIEGTPITGITYATGNEKIGADITINHTFSAMPAEGMYANYFEKMHTYIEIISHPAMVKCPETLFKNHRPPEFEDSHSPFQYPDTFSGRVGITAISEKLRLENIAIIGLGGTGSYILDLVSKTLVKKIYLFDGDLLLPHNAFRIPGAASREELSQKLHKVEYLKSRYSQMHKGIIVNSHHITQENIGMLRNMNFTFICIDNGPAKKIIIDTLVQYCIPFIDVGIGINNTGGKLSGSIAVTIGTPNKLDHIGDCIDFADAGNDDYSTNIQIAELNMLNASLAVMKWKKYYGFYHDIENELHSIYDTDGNYITNGVQNVKKTAA